MAGLLDSPSKKVALLGIVLAGSIFAYGTLQNGPQIPDLSSSQQLPVPTATLPPPASFFMGSEPPTSVPGIRRLKVMRPVLQTATGLSDSPQAKKQKDLYLTGTKSAELIRKPVEPHVGNFPTVSLDQAIEAALAVDEWGFQVVQNYLNQALGDETQIKMRTKAILDGLEGMAGEVDLETIADAANQVIEAAARTHWSAFMSPMVLDKNFKLQDGAIGWDFGPESAEPYDGFIRVPKDSEMVVGSSAEDTYSTDGSSILSQGVKNIEEFVATGLENGIYRVVILTSELPSGEEPLYPFGVDMKRNGGQLNLVDTRATNDLVPVMRLATEGPGRLAAAAGPAGQNTPPERGQMLVTRAEVTDGTLRLDFRQIGGQNTYVTSVIIYPEGETTLIEEIRTEIAELVAAVAPAAGDAPTDINQVIENPMPVIDPDTAFSDNGNGLPTDDAAASTPTGSDGGTGTTDTNTGTTDTGTTDTTGGTTTPPTVVPDIGVQPETPPDTNTGGNDTPNLVAEAGAYSPISLGEDFTLNGCSSTFAGESACNLTDTGAFELVWLLDGEEIGTGETLVVDTGEGTLFTESGEYEITLEIRYDGAVLGPDGTTITLADGTTIFLPGDLVLTSVDTAIIRIIVSVPEPESIFLIAPGLALLAQQERRRRRRRKAKLAKQTISQKN